MEITIETEADIKIVEELTFTAWNKQKLNQEK